MKKLAPSFFFVFCFVFIGLNVSAQYSVIDVKQFKLSPDLRYQADVDGKLLIADDLLNSIKKQQDSKAFEVYAGWPVVKNGNSTRGGIYCNLDADPELEIVYCIGQQVYALNMDGSLVEGWPVATQLFPDGAPAFGDIDGDGMGEIVVSTRQAGTGNTGKLMAFHMDGSTVSGFPVTLNGGATKTAVLADLNDDNVMEIIVEERAYPDGYVGVYSGDGNAWPGFPVLLDYIPASAVAVGDITGDGIPEIVAESYYSVYAFDVNGNVLEGFPYAPGADRVFSYSSPVLADLDDDGIRDIVVGDHSLSAGNGAVHVINHLGSSLEGWPQFVSYWLYGPAAVGDIDGDGQLDVAVGDQVLSGSASDNVYAWDRFGNDLAGWPVGPFWAINNQIILADIDNDNAVELIWDDNTDAAVYLGYNHDGSPMAGWPLPVLGSTFFMNPFVADLNNDGIYDMSGGGINLSTYDINLYLWNTNLPVNSQHSPLTVLQYNVRHDGVYVDASALNVVFSATPTSICYGSETTFNDESTGGVISWNWTFEGGTPTTSNEQNPVVMYENPGAYDVSLEVSDGSSSTMLTKTDYIHVGTDPEIPGLPVGPNNFSTDTANFTYYQCNASNANAYVWELNPSNVGVIIDGDTMNQIKIYWSNASNYSASLKVKSVNVCGESDFSDSLNIHVNWISGMANTSAEKPFTIYPNPAKEQITIRRGFDLETSLSADLLNAYGQIIRHFVFHPKQEEMIISRDGLASGIYYLNVKTATAGYVEKFLFMDE